LTIVIHSSANNYLQDTACVSYVLNGQTYSASGNYVQLYQTVEGCDSNIHLQLVILEPDSNSMNVIECGSYTLNGQTYTQSGNYQQIYQNLQGCDSVLLLNLQLLETWSQQVIVTSCDSFQFNGISYTHGGAYQQHYTKTNGCDSTYYLSLTLLSANDSVTAQGATLHAYISGAIYQWLECPSMQPVPGAVYQHFNPTKNGDYALAIEDLGCKDTSACFTLTDVGVGDFDVPSIEIFPNPAHKILHLKGETDGDTASIVLLDITGHVMECQTQQRGNELDIHVSHLSVGLYYLRIIYQGRSFVYKWMKE
ncbi:MAG TPA: T9SS type A sorting domain-containing protein, partial [Chitinophagaceae bacterium]|nr:T9SS type A sorting domain-containing protein [Chitinophagaceae bacterium]